MYAISNNHFSHDDQVMDAVSALTNQEFQRLQDAFPGWSSFMVLEAANVDEEYPSWVADWIENNTSIQWIEGEPYRLEPGDEEDENKPLPHLRPVRSGH